MQTALRSLRSIAAAKKKDGLFIIFFPSCSFAVKFFLNREARDTGQ
jgi:hypothetical protein